jgi:3-methyladenine DNA glycosylase AlkD
MTTAAQVMDELKALGKEQYVAIYRRHGIKGPIFGISVADLKKLQKKLKINHDLALALWATGNYDARILAMMIADPKRADSSLLDEWVRELGDYGVADALSTYIRKTTLVREKMEQWIQSDGEWIATVGWNLLGCLALDDPSFSDEFFESYLAIIERDIHNSQNRVRYAMNNAVIQIGVRNAALAQKATAAAKRIGYVDVDHGETNCKTPDAASYIKKAREYQDKKKATA